MLAKRIVTGIVAGGMLLAVLYWFPWLVATILMFATIVSTLEASCLLIPAMFNSLNTDGVQRSAASPLLNKTIIVFTVCVATLIYISIVFFEISNIAAMISFGFATLMLISCFLYSSTESSVAMIVGSVFALAYGLFPWLVIWQLYELGNIGSLLFLMIVVWSGDTTAYIVGKKWGRFKLYPQKSPGKTVEGSVAGAISSVLFGFIFAFLIRDLLQGSWTVVLIASVLMAVSSQLGDLFESTLKRFAAVKDSGYILPGHGGFLDRVDGLIFAAPMFWLVLYLHEVVVQW